MKSVILTKKPEDDRIKLPYYFQPPIVSVASALIYPIEENVVWMRR